jgi:Tc toxin complex TcA C-terminal TcB-binding domain/Neuraminidase-like domain
MAGIIFPLTPGMRGSKVADLQDALRQLVEQGALPVTDAERRAYQQQLLREREAQTYGDVTTVLVRRLQQQERLLVSGQVDEATARVFERLLTSVSQGPTAPTDDPASSGLQYQVSGVVRAGGGRPVAKVRVAAFDKDLRSEEALGEALTDAQGTYRIQYAVSRFAQSEIGTADLIVRALAEDGTTLASSPVLFNAPPQALVDLTLADGPTAARSLIEIIEVALRPLLGRLAVEDLEEDVENGDLTFLASETGIGKSTLARFAMASRMAWEGLQPEFWFALLGGSVFAYDEGRSLQEQARGTTDSLPSIDEGTVRKALARAFGQYEIPAPLRDKTDEWIEAFMALIASRSVGDSGESTLARQALDDAGVESKDGRERFARLLNEHNALSPNLLAALAKDNAFTPEQIDDLQTSFQLTDITRADFSVVKTIKGAFNVRTPVKIRSLARASESDWIDLITHAQKAGDITLPLAQAASPGPLGGVGLSAADLASRARKPAGPGPSPADLISQSRNVRDSTPPPSGAANGRASTSPQPITAELYGKELARRFRDVFPTAAFGGSLDRALKNGGAKGLSQGQALSDFLSRHDEFDLLHTRVDEFLDKRRSPTERRSTADPAFRSEIKAVQRVFKLAPTFEATNAMLADGVHSAQLAYRMGESEFVRSYSDKAGMSPAEARLAWNRAADTHAATLTVVGELKAYDGEAVPLVLKSDSAALDSFPNWEHLFQSGDICHCEDCRSVLSPAAYFADLLMYLKDRKATNPAFTVKDILFGRRPDLGYLELNCDNALVPLPYVDVVCEVLESAVAKGASDVELGGFAAMPAAAAAAKAAVAAALTAAKLPVGADFSLSQVDTADPNRWVVHGEDVTYLLKKNATPNFFAQLLPNTKADAAELRAYPAYVSVPAYETLRQSRFPFHLPFDLFAEEVRAAFQKCNLQRWDLMRTLRGAAAPNNPSDGDIAAEYFGISCDTAAAFDEKRIILIADAAPAAQQILWGEQGNAGWLNTVANVKTFLNKTALEYEQLLALLDLKFINPAGDIVVDHLDGSCDTDKKVLAALDATKLDRIQRFLRLWRKLDGWKMWEVDLVLRCGAIGAGALDEPFLVRLYYFARLRARLGSKVSVEQLCALFDDLNTETRFVELHKKRDDGLYQALFLNRKVARPIDPAFDVAAVDVPAPTVEKISGHSSVVLAALGIRQVDLDVLTALTRATTGVVYISDDLTLANLSFLWRHAWLAKNLKYKAEDWRRALQLLQQDVATFADPQAAWQYVERLDLMKATGFTPDELAWLLTGDLAAKAAPKEADTTRALTALRTELQGIRAQFDPTQYPFLSPPTDVDALTALLTSLLQRLNRDEAGTQSFVATLREEVTQQVAVAGLPAGFDFPAAIKNAIRIRYDEPATTLHFTGLMTPVQRATLLTDASLAAVTGIATYQQAIADLFSGPRLALKFFDPVFTAPLENLPAAVDFSSLLDPALVLRISYDTEERLLRCTGILSSKNRDDLMALSGNLAYKNAVNSLFTQPSLGAFPPEQVWLEDADLQFPLRDLNVAANDHLAVNLASAITQALQYLLRTTAESAVVRLGAAQTGLSEALTRRLFTEYPLLPAAVLKHMTETFAGTSGVVDYASLPTTFDAWYWGARIGAMWRKWKIALQDWKSLRSLTANGQLLSFETVPLNSAAVLADTSRFIRTHRLLRMRDSLPETIADFFEVLVTLDAGGYAAFTDFAADVGRLNDSWSASDAEALIGTLDLAYPNDYLLAESWERLRRSFYFLDNLTADAATVAKFGAATMDDASAKALGELLRAKLGAESWLQVSAEIQDVLRERKRDALSSYLLSQPQPANVPTGKWEDTNDLYAYYLLDVEMCSCMLTSRLVQASGSVQLFVQRCFMGLEPQVAVKADGDDGDSAWRWWQWMRKYRVWEANRKVFLWPENWIEPELKKDRSNFFKELENDLAQNEVNSDSVEIAFRSYLEKLDGVAQLEIAGFFQEDDADETIVHVFGRTAGAEPHVYFYRRFDYRQWTPWEKVALDIQGDYLIPAVINRRLFLFWPVFTEVQDEQANTVGHTVPHADQTGYQPNKTYKKLKLQMAVSDLRQGKWTPKRISKGWIETSSYPLEIERSDYRFYPVDRSATEDRFAIKCDGNSIGRDGSTYASLTGPFNAFDLSGCQGTAEPSYVDANFVPAVRPEVDSAGSTTKFLKWKELDHRTDAPQNDLTLQNSFASSSNGLLMTPVLDQTPWFFRVSPPWHLSYLDRLMDNGIGLLAPYFGDLRIPRPFGIWMPFFYNDKKRTFFVLPALWSGAREAAASGTQLQSYYPDVKREIRKWRDFFEGLFRTWADGLDLSTLTAAQLAALDQALAARVPTEFAPPFSDERRKDLLAQFFMKYVDYYLGAIALLQYPLRRFHFRNFYHPFVCDFSKLLQNPLEGVPGLMRRETQLKDSGFSFKLSYQPRASVIDHPLETYYPREVVDFDPDGSYASYNWELFFHAPLLIANSLSRNQRFEEARDWYHFIFNPVGVESAAPGGSAMSKYWITKPFYERASGVYLQQRIDNILAMIAGDTSVAGYSPAAKKALEDQVRDWRANPFEPHRIANYRGIAYQKTVVMKYLDNLIAWGDYLFRQDSMESINEATQLYVLAAEILGPAPKKVPPRDVPPLESFNELEKQFDAFSNALVEVENLIPPQPGNGPGSAAPLPMLYFCIPRNEKLLEYWGTVADRLYKIRHCLNIEGVVRQLALFEPPIDPGALVKAVAGGVDIGAALADLNAPLPLYRFNVMLQKANEVCADVKALGASLLSALEKNDSEALGRLRQGQEIRLLQAVKAVREAQIDEARQNLAAIQRGQELAQIKKQYYETREFMNAGEITAVALNTASTAIDAGIAIGYGLAGGLKLIPDFVLGAAGFGGSPTACAQTGGKSFGDSAEDLVKTLESIARALDKAASLSSTIAGYERRKDDWDNQLNLAVKELEQFDSQIAAAQLRISIAESERDNQVLQIENAQAVDEFMRSKYTNQELYQWQIGQISAVYFQSYRLAYDLAKRAERCYRFELGVPDSSYVSFGYWDSLKKGLMAGEKLQYDLRRLESAHLEQNRREFELTKHVSLAMRDPLALVRLRETGRCFLQLPEETFDLDFPGHYFRRIKSVSLTLPCVVGPYTTVSCTLRLLKNSVRVNTSLDGQYARNTDDDGLPADDTRFIENNIPVKAIAASSGQNDSGVFELNFRDDRYVPFEGAGAISEWALELFNDLPANNPNPASPDFGRPLRQFDYDTITDAILHVKYTAREDAGQFKNAAVARLREYLAEDGATPGMVSLDLRRDFPSEWARFLSPTNPANGNVLEIAMARQLFFVRDTDHTLKINTITVLARCTDAGNYSVTFTPPLPVPPPAGSNKMTLVRSTEYGGLHFAQKHVTAPDIELVPTDATQTWRLRIEHPGGGNLVKDPMTQAMEVEDVLVVLGYEWED